jgi:hypothetical protein
MTRIKTWHVLLVMAVGFPGCVKNVEEKTESADEAVTKLDGSFISTKVVRPTTKTPIDTQYITKDFIGAIVVRPSQMFASQFAKNMQAELVKAVREKLISLDFGEQNPEEMSGEQINEFLLSHMERDLGFDPRYIDQVTELVDEVSLMQYVPVLMTGQGDPPLPTIIVRFNDEVIQQDFREWIAEKYPLKTKEKTDVRPKKKGNEKKQESLPEEPAQFPAKKHGGHIYHLVGKLAVCFGNKKTMLVAKEELLEKMLKARNVDSPLTRQLSKLGAEHDVILALNMSPLGDLLKSFPQKGMPADLVKAFEFVTKMKSFALTTSLTDHTFISVVTQMSAEKNANDFAELIREKGVKFLLAEYQKLKATEKEETAEAKSLIKLMDQMIAGLSVGHQKTDVVMTITRPDELDMYPMQFRSVLREIHRVAKLTQRKADLKNIGHAFHDFHEVYGHFPAADSNGAMKGLERKSGLSWRVYLLPFLDEQLLYDQFKHDEPWDSPHNKSLISKMPAIFANFSSKISRKNGKTSIHVFVGKNKTPFGLQIDGESVGAMLQVIRNGDGTARTLMAVEAGEDRAKIWTKPGGLPFDPQKNPLDLLGKLPEKLFVALFCDGHARIIKSSISPAILRNLIQHNDNQLIDEKDIP